MSSDSSFQVIVDVDPLLWFILTKELLLWLSLLTVHNISESFTHVAVEASLLYKISIIIFVLSGKVDVINLNCHLLFEKIIFVAELKFN